jgi:hypothetical protein
MRLWTHLVGVVLVAVSTLAFPGRASAAERPYSASGTAQFVSPNDFVGSGYATHLGRYTEAGHASFSPTSNPEVLQVDASSVYTAGNGDELHATITGELNVVTGVISATVTYDGGTGRFAGASGSAALAAQMLPGGAIVASVSGSIDY